ncbi:MAG: HlyD family efflux transporter periplasmic adaptor subunit [Proteobacteria bacterium]|nr:HlyD family efflux transporter periplasmic adaptor subunit [Pseudomonadota bacterium]
MMKWLIFLLLGGLIFITLQTPAVMVEKTQASYAAMKVTAEEEGKTRVIDRFSITAPIDAYMKRIDLSAGDTVKKGQTIIVLEPVPSSVLDPSSRSQAEAVLGASQEMENIIEEISEAAKAELDLANISYTRADELHKKKHIAEHELDVTKANKRRAEAIYRASQFGWVFSKYLTQMSHSALDYENVRHTDQDSRIFKISSTTTGKVLNLADKSERLVKAGELLMEVGDVKQLEVEVEVLSKIAVKLRPDMPVELHDWGGEQFLQGKIKTIESSGFMKVSALGVEEQRVKVIVSIHLHSGLPPHKIGDGFRIEARFILWQADKVLQIPNSALFIDKLTENKKQWSVYVIDDGRLKKRAVKIGHKNNLMAEVLEGLVENEVLVSYLSNDLEEDLKVEIR